MITVRESKANKIKGVLKKMKIKYFKDKALTDLIGRSFWTVLVDMKSGKRFSFVVDKKPTDDRMKVWLTDKKFIQKNFQRIW